MNDLALARLSSLSTPTTRTWDSAPPAATWLRTAAASGGSSWWQLGHQFPKNSRTVGSPPRFSDETVTVGPPTGPTFLLENEGTGPPVTGAEPEPEPDP